MAGHSKWANIKHKKDRADKKKGKIFSNIAKEIISAVKQSGPDPKTNSKLKLVIQKARNANMPNENIERNIKKASSSDQSDYFEMTYELYGHGGVGIIVDVVTDNKNRISSEMRIATNKCGGNVANVGAVAFNFDKKGVLQVNKNDATEDDLFMLISDLGAEEFDTTDDAYMITTKPEDLYRIKEELQKVNINADASIEMIPKTLVPCSKEDEEANKKLIEWLDNIDDVDAVYNNMETSS